ncbi:MAG TPA: hypothetical protein VHI98_15070 [Vicinamibacterales bacterium]|jgi:hypothetical protein|nr:hypothetical protein [Vicinamibacterales bacterium]
MNRLSLPHHWSEATSTSARPSNGTPVGQYSKDAKPIAPVTPGPGATIKLAFSDAVRMQ